MIKDRTALENHLEKKFKNLVFDKKKMKEITEFLEKNRNLPTGMTTDIITGRVGISIVSNVILFFVTEAIEPKLISEYFTQIEQTEWKEIKYERPNTIKLPIVLPMDQVSADCWIGATDAEFYLSLSNAQLIRYNSNTQRVMKRLVKDQEEYYVISVNKAAVNEIAEEFKNKTFIPNELTLNISPESEANFFYDKEKRTMTINSIECFDIIDGYHRLLAMSRCANEDESFNYPMKLCITYYDELKARHFIAQEDKKTHMQRIDSQSMDNNLSSNYIVERLNTDFDSNLKDLISRNEGKVNYSELSDAINKIWFKRGSKTNKVELLKSLKAKWNYLSDTIPELLENKIDSSLIYTITVIFSLSDEPNQIIEMYNRVTNDKDYKLKKINDIIKYFEE